MGPRGNIVTRVGLIPVSPQNVFPRAFSLTELFFNNVVEYNAMLIGMQLAEEIDIEHLKAYGDSKLIIN